MYDQLYEAGEKAHEHIMKAQEKPAYYLYKGLSLICAGL